MNKVTIKFKSYNYNDKRKTIPNTKKITNCIRKNNSIHIVIVV